MYIRILDNDGLDEVYSDVVKATMVDDDLFIYTPLTMFKVYKENILFMQMWTDDSIKKGTTDESSAG
jgi:hypothetical protein